MPYPSQTNHVPLLTLAGPISISVFDVWKWDSGMTHKSLVVLELRVLMQFQGWGGRFPSCVWRYQASLQRGKAGADMQQGETRNQDPQGYSAADTTRPLVIASLDCVSWRLNTWLPLQLELAMWLRPGQWHWGGLPFWNKRQVFTRRELFALRPFAVAALRLLELSLGAGSAVLGLLRQHARGGSPPPRTMERKDEKGLGQHPCPLRHAWTAYLCTSCCVKQINLYQFKPL